MSHAEARELIEQRYSTPAGDGLADPAAVATLEAHLAECADCRREHDAMRATAAALQLALGPSPQMRGRVLDNVARIGRPRGAESPTATGRAFASAGPTPAARAARRGRLVPFPRALAAAAALAVIAFVAGALSADYLGQRNADSGLARAAMVMAELARDPQTETMTLHDPSGAAGGTLMYEPDADMLVVFSQTLAAPDGGSYGCYLERDGERTWIGPMLFEADTAYWAGPTRMSGLGQPGDRFLVLTDADDPTPMLSASF